MAASIVSSTLEKDQLTTPAILQPIPKLKDTRRSGKTCEVSSCRKSRRNAADVKLFKFTKNPDERKTWAAILNIPIDTLSRNPVLCQDHFNPKHLSKKKLLKNATPISSSEAKLLKINQLEKYSSIKSGRSGKIDVVLIPTVVKVEPIEIETQSVIQAGIANSNTNPVDLIEIKTESEPQYISMANDQYDDYTEEFNVVSTAETTSDPEKAVASTCERKTLHKGLVTDKRATGKRCKVPNCRKSKRKHTDMVLRKCPTDSGRLAAWASILNMSVNDLSDPSYICSDHFSPDSIGSRFLKKNALPINIYGGTIQHKIKAANPNATITSTNQRESLVKSNTQSADETEVDFVPESETMYTALLSFEMDMQTDTADYQEPENQIVRLETVADSVKDASIPAGRDNEISCPKCHQLLMVETDTYSKIITLEEKHAAYEPIATKKHETVYTLREKYRQIKMIARRKRHKIKKLALQIKVERHRYNVLKKCAQKQSTFWLDVLGRISAAKEVKNMLTIRKPTKKGKFIDKNQFSSVFFITNN